MSLDSFSSPPSASATRIAMEYASSPVAHPGTQTRIVSSS
ncbi:hypothetical protein RB2654_15025 [Rhodobacterales bacterium HTCC2654]|uniref:Uncharacterized protein n=1 Tax=Maritimibacter alkaliphilus HTCC2654 TaxID=314271 RepID=A3VH54_9RHOB|nr:hypothetical protein RB2654_15025 [Rhodobacterales bacterium HTCC2654] [Maritimibacter alkaliphilus HTCC2654]